MTVERGAQRASGPHPGGEQMRAGGGQAAARISSGEGCGDPTESAAWLPSCKTEKGAWACVWGSF